MGDSIRQQEGTAGPQGPHPPMQSGEISQCGAALFQGALVRGEVAHLQGPQANSAPVPEPAVKAVRIDQRTG